MSVGATVAITVTGGEGQDTFRLRDAYQDSSQIMVVTDFTPGAGGDILDLNPSIYLPYDSQFSYLRNLRLVRDGADTLLQSSFPSPVPVLPSYLPSEDTGVKSASEDPAGTQAPWQTRIRLENVAITDLTADNFSPTAPLGFDPASSDGGTATLLAGIQTLPQGAESGLWN